MKDSELKNSIFYHNIKKLLKDYSDIKWQVSDSILDIKETAEEYGGRQISEFVKVVNFELESFDYTKDLKTYQERLMSISETKIMIDIIDK